MITPQAEAEDVNKDPVGPPEYVSHRANRQKIARHWPWEVTDRDHLR